MPGVPSSRGCDGCRKQKKKCGAAIPPCARCQRLRIPCVGLGQQRYKFKIVEPSQRSTDLFQHATVESREPPALEIFRPMSNDLSRLRAAFVKKIDPTIDIQYQLLLNFGPFLSEIPRRLGKNEALDTACDSLVAVYSGFCAGHVSPYPEALMKYSRTLNVIRRYVDDPTRAYSSETLCATMILLLHQPFLGADAVPGTSHAVGAAQILKARGYCGPRDEFEGQLLLSLRGPVVFDALLSDKISFTEQQWRDLVLKGLAKNKTLEGGLLMCSAQTSVLMQRGRNILNCKPPSTSAIKTLRQDVRALLAEFRPTLTASRVRYSNFHLTTGSLSAQAREVADALYTKTYSLSLAIGVIIIYVLNALGEGDDNLCQEASHMSDEILQLADISMRYRPLGSLSMRICLRAAYLGATEEKTRMRAVEYLAEYRKDSRGPTWNITPKDLESVVKHFTMK